uniref:noggin-like n=1 Tax=Jaculus jaculus TaxID=51337 RepID=UPI001E1B24DF|nr:noggin-like [Jaculus jaculus]
MARAPLCPRGHFLPLLLLFMSTSALNPVPDAEDAPNASWARLPEPWTPQDEDLWLIRSRPAGPPRPYGLSRESDNYQYAPPAEHVRPERLLRLLGASYDPFWMAAEEPRGEGTGPGPGQLGTLSRELADRVERYRGQLMREVAALPLPALPAGERIASGGAWGLRDAARALRRWLVELASCGLTSAWVDLGPVFWPRWVRHTDCDTSPRSCSWPPGMTCRPAQTTHIQLLAWHCWLRPGLPPGPEPQQCAWRRVLYPVVAACKCSCH